MCCREQKKELAEKLKAKAQELAEQFKADWQPVAENLDRAMKAFDDLEGASLRSSAARPHITVWARNHQLPLLVSGPGIVGRLLLQLPSTQPIWSPPPSKHDT